MITDCGFLGGGGGGTVARAQVKKNMFAPHRVSNEAGVFKKWLSVKN